MSVSALDVKGVRSGYGEAPVVRDDPVGQVAAVRAARDAEPIRIGQAILYQRVDAGEDVSRGTRPPITVIRVVEPLAHEAATCPYPIRRG